MKTLDDIFEALGTSSDIASEVGGISDRAVRAWRLEDRNGIPPRHWPAIIRLARKREKEWITWEVLEQAHSGAGAA